MFDGLNGISIVVS